MRITVAFPNVGAPNDRVALRDYAQALEGLGVDTLHVVDHVVYAWPNHDGSPRSQYRADLWHLEAFATLYTEAAAAITAMREGQTLDAAVTFPGIDDGFDGIAFVDAALRSSAAGGMWTEIAES